MFRSKKQIIILVAILIIAGSAVGGVYYWKQRQEQQISKQERQQRSLELSRQAEDLINNAKYAECEKLAQQAVDLDENNIEAIIFLARSKYVQGKVKEARDVYVRGVEKDPKNLKMNFYVANIYRDLQEFELSKKHYKIATEIEPHNILLWHNYAVSYAFDQNDWEGAVRVYEEALELNPDDEFLQKQYGVAKENVQATD